MDNPGEILRLCRLCLVKDQVNIPIFAEQGDSREIFLKISSCLPVKVSIEDRLPKKICDGCSEKLNSFYEFWSSSANAEKTLLSWLGEDEVEEKKVQAVPKSLTASATLVKEESAELVDEAHAESIEESTKDESEAPPTKRARRSAAVKAQINLAPDSEDDDLDTTEPLTKMEEESADSDGEEKDPSYTEMPGTSADDEQAGPSGMGKDGVEAPFDRMNLFEKAKFLKTHFSRECRVILTDLKLLQNSTKTTDQRRRKHYSCYVCFAKFSTSRELENHKLTHQNDDEEDEQNSKETRPQKGKIVNVTATESSNYKCITCDANFADQLEVKAHVHTQYRCKYFCGRCGRFFNTKGGFIVHLIQHSMDNTVKLSYRCEKCSSTFDDCYKLKRHYVMVHSSRQIEEEKKSEKPVVTVPLTDPGNPITGIIPIFDCDVCYDVFSTKRALQRHKAMHEKLDKKDSPAPIFIEDDESTESAKEFDKIETTNQITQMLGGKLAFPQLHYPNQIQANSPQPSTSNTSSFMLINPTNSIQTNQPTPTTSTAPILLNPTLPSVQQSMVNISNLDPTKTYYVVLPNTKEVKPQNSPMIPATVVPKLAKIQPAPIPDNFVMPVITSFGTVTEDVTSKKRTDPTSQYESEYAKFLTSGKQKKVLPNTQAGGNIETITIVDPEPAVGSSVHQPKIFVKKFAQLKDVASEDGAVDSKVDCAFCGTSLENSAAYREHFASHHF